MYGTCGICLYMYMYVYTIYHEGSMHTTVLNLV